MDELEELKNQFESVINRKTISKLNRLYRGEILHQESTDNYINLSSHALTEQQKNVLNLGINCSIQTKFDKNKKKIELELLYESILSLQRNQHVTVNPDLREQFRGESTICRDQAHSSLLTPELRQAAKELKNNQDIVIRKADKSNVFVVLDKQDYRHKLNEIITDTSKFERITADPTERLQRKVNKLIATANAINSRDKLTPIVGSYTPGYLYGNVKTHKTNYPVRPIISQVTTAIYQTAKELDKIIKPYIPKQYSISSTDQFLDILRSSQPVGELASLDVVSLFTNVPVTETVDIILENVYEHNHLSPPTIPRSVMKNLLFACTSESPFRTPENKIYRQINGVAMGSPLAPTFAEFYMCNLENAVLDDGQLKPSTYCRYVDDIFVVVRDKEHLDELRTNFENNSVLNFTYEMSIHSKIPFLDVSITNDNGTYITTVFRKPTNNGKCMNPKGECPERYKRSVIHAYVSRAHKVCSSPELLQEELRYVKQILVNNGFTNRDVDHQIQHYQTPCPAPNSTERIVYYQNQMSSAYKTDERVIKNIVRRNVQCTNEDDKMVVRVYYKNTKSFSLVTKNNLTPAPSSLQKTNVVYEFSCPEEDCKLLNNVKYIGMTTTTLSRRLTCHLSSGSPKDHMLEKHGTRITREILVKNTKIIKQYPDKIRLKIGEALHIFNVRPIINMQNTGFEKTLKLFRY